MSQLQLIGSRGQELGLAIGGMGQMVAAFAGFSLSCQQAVHGADGAVILLFIEQGRIDGGERAILKAFVKEISQDGSAFRRRQGAYRTGPRSGPGGTRTAIPVLTDRVVSAIGCIS